jgi:hypothetical protein
MSTRRGWFDLPRGHRGAVLSTAFLVPATHVLVRVIDYRRTMAMAEWSAGRWPFRRTTAPTPEVVDAFRLATTRVQRYSPLPGNCLSRSLVLWWALRRRGLPPELRFGVSLAGGTFAAHAWVELDAVVLNDRQDVASRYAPLTRPEARQSFN